MKRFQIQPKILWLVALTAIHLCFANPCWAENRKNRTKGAPSKTDCQAELLATYQSNHISKLNPSPENSQPCEKHPWIIEIKRWQQQAVGPVEAATLLISLEQDNNDLNNVPKPLRDHHMMAAAFTLAQNGWTTEARALWENLLTRHTEWPELWLNLAVSDLKLGLYNSATQRMTHIERLCETKNCLMNSDYIKNLQLAILEISQTSMTSKTTPTITPIFKTTETIEKQPIGVLTEGAP
jgi:hypothetical protein